MNGEMLSEILNQGPSEGGNRHLRESRPKTICRLDQRELRRSAEDVDGEGGGDE